MTKKERYIDAEAFERRCMFDKNIEDMQDVIYALRDYPEADVEPVRHGKWIDEGQIDDFFSHHAWKCSQCGEHVLEIGVPWYKYCPECGAKMDGERKE